MKKFFAAMIMVCLVGAFSNQAMAQGPRDNGRPGPKPAAVHHQPAPGNHVNAVPGPRPAARPTPPPPAPRHAKPAPPPPARHHARPLPPPEPAPRPVIDYRPGVGLYIGGEHFGFTISL